MKSFACTFFLLAVLNSYSFSYYLHTNFKRLIQLKSLHNNNNNKNTSDKVKRASTASLNLYNLRNCYESSFFDQHPEWDFHLMEANDLEEVSELTLECFYEPKLNLNTTGMAEMEKLVWSKIIEFSAMIDKFEIKVGNYLGFKSRGGERLYKPTLKLLPPHYDSVILVATQSATSIQKDSNKNSSAFINTSDSKNKNSKPSTHRPAIVGIVEICLEPADQKLTSAYRYPWTKKSPDTDEAYLCNLGVSDMCRRKGLGTILCQLCEEIVVTTWKKQYMYLHVEQRNVPGQKLYINLGYKPFQIMPYWQLKFSGLENILYFAKDLSKSSNNNNNINYNNNSNNNDNKHNMVPNQYLSKNDDSVVFATISKVN